MFRHDPRAMMYAPLHTVIWEDRDGGAGFTVDQPSKQFASFDIPVIAEVGIELDHKRAALLSAVEVEFSPSSGSDDHGGSHPAGHSKSTSGHSLRGVARVGSPMSEKSSRLTQEIAGLITDDHG
jgi:hypothetical protein